MGRPRGHTKRKQQQQQSGGDRNNSYNAQSHDGSRDEQKEGIQIKGASRGSSQGQCNGRQRGRGREQEPEQSDSDSRSQPRHRDISKHPDTQSRTPKALTDRITRGKPEQQERARSNQTPTPAAQAPAKRKQAPENDEESQSGKRARKHGEMHPIAQEIKAPATDAPTANNAGVPSKLAQHVTPAKQDGARPKVAATGTRGKPITKASTTTEEASKQSSEKSASDIQKGQALGSVAPAISNSPSFSKSGTPPSSRKRPSPEEINEGPSKESRSESSQAGISCTRTAVSGLPVEEGTKAPTSFEIAKKRSKKICEMMNDLPVFEEANVEKELKFIDYGVFSIPLLCSTSIEHQHHYESVYKLPPPLRKGIAENTASIFELTMIEQRQKALYLSRQNILTSEDLGRNKVRKSKATRIIDDCDLYLYEGKIYVATERGLLPAAEYLQLIGVPDEQPVRFQGHEPAWMAPVKAKREHRRVLVSYEVTSEEEKQYGNIDIFSGSRVVVYESGVEVVEGEEIVMAYGVRVEDGVKGWFPYAHTCRMDWSADTPIVRDSSIIDWTTFDYEPLVAQGAARQAQENARQAVAVQALIQKNEAEKAAAAAAVAPQVAAILEQMSPIVLPPRHVPMPSPPVAALSAPAPRLSGSPSIPATPAHQATADVAEASITSGSEDSTPIAAPSQFSNSQEDTVQTVIVANGPIGRHDSPQSRSDKAISEKNDDEVDETVVDQDKTTAAADSPVTAKEKLGDAFTKQRKSLLGFDKKVKEDAKKKKMAGKKARKEAKQKAEREAKYKAEEALGRYDEVADWDTSDDDCVSDEEEEEEDENEEKEERSSDDEEL
jgi:hypothetical protein